MTADAVARHGFYVMAGGAAAALTGLVVVALSLHAKAIMAHALFRDRAFAAIVALMTQVFLAAAVLVPTQSSLALGLEVASSRRSGSRARCGRSRISVATPRACGAERTRTADPRPTGRSNGRCGSYGSSR